jgi:hypothetical protein
MASRQAAANRAPAKERNTGKRKAAKAPMVATSTPKRPHPRPRPKLNLSKFVEEPAEENDEAEIDVFEEGNLMLLTKWTQMTLQSMTSRLRRLVVFSMMNIRRRRMVILTPVRLSSTLCYNHSAKLFFVGPAIEIAFEVPYKNAFRDLTIKSDIAFAMFLTRVADKMETSIVHRSQIGYILPWKAPRTGKPTAKLLEDEEAFRNLINNVWQYIDEQKAKNKGKGKVKPFTIQIVDTTESVDKVRSLSAQLTHFSHC